jgi:hypothetical protein
MLSAAKKRLRPATKRARFLAKHPLCCFCGGVRKAATIDHVPARACFRGRAFPESFEFPACDACQNATRRDEIAFAFYCRMVDFNEANHDADELAGSVLGIQNNLKDVLPNPFMSANQKRAALRAMGLRKPEGMFLSDVPIIKFDKKLHEYILRYGRKIVCALFYREKGRPVPANYYVWAGWNQIANPTAEEALKAWIDMTPLVTIGARRNLDFGDRFGYRCNKADNPDVFAALCQFGQGLTISGVVVNPASLQEMNRSEEFVKVDHLFVS